MIAQLTIAYFLFLFVFLPLIRAELVGQLRQRYQEGCASGSGSVRRGVQRPRSGKCLCNQALPKHGFCEAAPRSNERNSARRVARSPLHDPDPWLVPKPIADCNGALLRGLEGVLLGQDRGAKVQRDGSVAALEGWWELRCQTNTCSW